MKKKGRFGRIGCKGGARRSIEVRFYIHAGRIYRGKAREIFELI